MSVYNGFSTRVQESKYGTLSDLLIGLLSTKILRMLKGEKTDDSNFAKQLASIHSKMQKLEELKYLPPKLSQGCNDLLDFCITSFQSCPSTSSFSLNDVEVPPSPRIFKTLSPISAHPLEQINEEKQRYFKKKTVFAQEKRGRPVQSSAEFGEINANSYYEKVMEKYTKLSNKYAPKSERSFSVGIREPELLYKDGIFFKT